MCQKRGGLPRPAFRISGYAATRAAVAADRLGGGGLDHATLQSVGQSGLSKNLRQPEKPQEEGYLRCSSQAPGPLLGDAVARNALERSDDNDAVRSLF